jgi:hypothetical protein
MGSGISGTLGQAEGPSRPGKAETAPPTQQAILQHLEHILTSPSFRNSKRCQDLLHYLVIRRLAGDWLALKERAIGIAVFGREPDYDTGADAIVRVRVNELRKRLASYYGGEGQSQAVRIELPPGSYVPHFHWANGSNAKYTLEPPPVQHGDLPAVRQAVLPRRWLVGAGAAVVALGAVGLRWAVVSRSNPLEQFWDPMLASGQPVLVCIPARERWFLARSVVDTLREAAHRGRSELRLKLHPGDIAVVPEGQMSVQNFRAIVSLTSWLAQRGVATDLRLVSQVTVQDMRRPAVVLVGAYHNPWAMDLNQKLRYVFESSHEGSEEVCWVKDRHRAGQSPWLIPKLWPFAGQSVDYAIISRTFNPTTGQVLLSVAGANGFGTQTAAEFLTAPAYWDSFLRMAPRGWERRNCQIVLETRVVSEVPSQPRILAVHVW